MTNHSNAITDILAKHYGDDSLAKENSSNLRAAKALYEAVKLAIPDEEMMQQKGDDLWSWNDCRAEFLTNLSLLFGVDLADSSKPSTSVEPKDTKSLTLVSTWRGKKLDEYTMRELIEIICELGQALQQESYEHSRQLDVVNDLVRKGFKR